MGRWWGRAGWPLPLRCRFRAGPSRPSEVGTGENVVPLAGGATRPSRLKRKNMLVGVACALLAAGPGCGGGEGVSAGATVAAYVEAPLCAGAKRELASEGARTGLVRVRVVCLAAADDGKRLDLATIGANARRATEDATTVAYIEPPVTPSFSRPIVEAASIPVIRTSSGEAAMAQLLRAIAEADDSSSLRAAVRKNLNES